MSRLLQHLHQQKKQIEALCKKFGVRRIRVFSSVARGEEQADSDIDFLVDFPRAYDLFKQRIPLAESLAKLLGREIDLLPEHEINQYIKEPIFNEAVAL